MRDLAIRWPTLATGAVFVLQVFAHTAAGQAAVHKRFGIAGAGIAVMDGRAQQTAFRGTGGFVGQAGMGYQVLERIAAQIDLSTAGFPEPTMTYDVCPENGCGPSTRGP